MYPRWFPTHNEFNVLSKVFSNWFDQIGTTEIILIYIHWDNKLIHLLPIRPHPSGPAPAPHGEIQSKLLEKHAGQCQQITGPQDIAAKSNPSQCQVPQSKPVTIHKKLWQERQGRRQVQK